MPLLGYEWPRLGFVDGTVATYEDAGFIFLFNPSPDTAKATVRLDQSLGLGTSLVDAWLLSEIYPREDGMPLGVWKYGDMVTAVVPGGFTKIIKLEPWTKSLQEAPIAFNISYQSIDLSDAAVVISGASALTGSTCDVIVRLPSDKKSSSIVLNDQSFDVSATDCFQGDRCIKATVIFRGSTSLRTNALAGPHKKNKDGSYDMTITVTSEMLAQLQDRQATYNISWTAEDLDASWLAPSRLLLYPYVARPSPSLADPVIKIDGKAASIVRQYNSRGNHAIVPPGGGAVSGNTARTFLGWYVDCSDLKADVPHRVSIKFPWKDSELEAHPFSGVYWHNIEDAFSKEPLPRSSLAFV